MQVIPNCGKICQHLTEKKLITQLLNHLMRVNTPTKKRSFWAKRMHSSTVCCSSRLGAGGVCLGECLRGRGSTWGIVSPGGVCLGGVHLPPWYRIADTCKNITFPQLRLRTVKICIYIYSYTTRSHSNCSRRLRCIWVLSSSGWWHRLVMESVGPGSDHCIIASDGTDCWNTMSPTWKSDHFSYIAES